MDTALGAAAIGALDEDAAAGAAEVEEASARAFFLVGTALGDAAAERVRLSGQGGVHGVDRRSRFPLLMPSICSFLCTQ